MVNDSKDLQSKFEAKAGETLRGGDQFLDDETLARLADARGKALLRLSHRNRIAWPAFAALAASLVVALVWSGWPQPEMPDAVLLESVDLLVAEESIEFYQDMDLLQWAELEEQLLLEELDDRQGNVTGGLAG
jgi:hypothetical protein